jgi:penicillin-binding protein 1A
MARAYATLAGGGVNVRPRAITRVEFPDGRVSKYGPGKRERVFDESIAAKVTDILQQNVIQGTGTSAQIGCPAAGKTGTTDEFRNAWFVGYTPNLATATWVGFPKNQLPMTYPNTPISVAGGTYPAQIWGAYMRSARKGCPEFSLEGGYSGTTLLGSDGANGAVPPATGVAPGAPPAAAPEMAPSPDETTPPAAEAGDGGGGGGGGDDGGYTPDLYETPPQSAPDTGPSTGGVSAEG